MTIDILHVLKLFSNDFSMYECTDLYKIPYNRVWSESVCQELRVHRHNRRMIVLSIEVM